MVGVSHDDGDRFSAAPRRGVEGAPLSRYTGRMRIGIVGLSRGLYMAESAHRIGIEVIALCDRDSERMGAARAEFPEARATADWSELLDAGLDGVVLANDFDAHAALAIAFLDHGIHVLSETAACASAEEGLRLIAAAERSTATYSFAENYVFHPHTRILRESVDSGELGAITLVEATICTVCLPTTRQPSSAIQHTGVAAYRRPLTARTPSHRCSTSRERGRWRSAPSLSVRATTAPPPLFWRSGSPTERWP